MADESLMSPDVLAKIEADGLTLSYLERRLIASYHALAQRVAELEAALEKYGEHRGNCKHRKEWDPRVCSCGLNALRGTGEGTNAPQ